MTSKKGVSAAPGDEEGIARRYSLREEGEGDRQAAGGELRALAGRDAHFLPCLNAEAFLVYWPTILFQRMEGASGRCR